MFRGMYVGLAVQLYLLLVYATQVGHSQREYAFKCFAWHFSLCPFGSVGKQPYVNEILLVGKMFCIFVLCSFRTFAWEQE